MKQSEEKKIIYVTKDKLHMFPPCVSQIVMLCDLGCKVYVVAEECDDSALKIIQNAGASVKILGNLNTKKGFLGRIYHWLLFTHKAIQEIKKVYCAGNVIWAANEGTAIALKHYLKKKEFVLTMLELYEYPFYVKGVNSIIRKAKATVACEKNRGRIMKQWFGINTQPFIMPNKPYYEMICQKSSDVEAIQKDLKDKKYILYQGVLSKDRSIKALARALNKTKEKYTLVVIGGAVTGVEEILEEIRKEYHDVLYGGFFPAPQHLYITENAHIGIAFYEPSSLNNMFCAPNKIFEYSKFNVPIIGNDIPGLQLSVEKLGAGICVDMEEPNEIAKAIDKISENYEEYQNGAERLYNSVDNLETTREILEKIEFIQKQPPQKDNL